MNIAVLISGEYREFDIAHKSWPFLKWKNVDYYLSTWSKTSEVNPRLNINIMESVTIQRALNAIKNIVDYSIDEPDSELIGHNNKMLNRWITGLNLIKRSGKKYDRIIIIRPDLYLDFDEPEFLKFLELIDFDAIYTYIIGGRNEIANAIQDQLILGTYDTVLKLLNSDVQGCKFDSNIHWYLAQEFKRIMAKIGHIPFGKFSICRSNCRGLNLNFNIVNEKAKEWYENKYHKEIKICDLAGFSGAKVELYRTPFNKKFVRKSGAIDRNLRQLELLNKLHYCVPSIITSNSNTVDMEYIPGIDIKTYLCRHGTSTLIEFLLRVLTRFSQNSAINDYSEIFYRNLQYFKNDANLPFTIDLLFEKLPKILPKSTAFHGDFTLENLIYSEEKGFYMIDVASGDYDSYIFDISKMRQDLECKWFLRDSTVDITAQLLTIKNSLYKNFPTAFDDNLYILMLLRVYKYCLPGSREFNLILSEIKRLWK